MEKTLVAYFSVSGNTKRVAEYMARVSGADLYEITPKVPYTKADLDYENPNSRCSLESNPESRPEIADTNANIAAYDTIFLGFPIWWYTAPTLINTFLEAYDFTGKKIVLFATSGISGIGKCIFSLRDSAPGAQMIEGRLLNVVLPEEDMKAFMEYIV